MVEKLFLHIQHHIQASQYCLVKFFSYQYIPILDPKKRNCIKIDLLMDYNKGNLIKNDRSLFRKANCTEFQHGLKNALLTISSSMLLLSFTLNMMSFVDTIVRS